MTSQENQDQARHRRGSPSGRPVSQPSLLPAFEPFSSSPNLPRPIKRKHEGTSKCGQAEIQHYPTPVPTSSTSVLPLSSPRHPSTRPGIQRTLSTVSERTPLATVPYVDLPESGDSVLMGRSSNSSHYQLSANRLISRVHVRATYRRATKPVELATVEIECLGWNGVAVHCQGQIFELGKGHTFTSDKPQAEIMLDVQDARVLVRWPSPHRKDSDTALSDATWDDEPSPRRVVTPTANRFGSSPPLPQAHLQSPISPSPRGRLGPTASTTFLGLPPSSPSHPSVQVYEDSPSADESGPVDLPSSANMNLNTAHSVSGASDGSSSLSDPNDYSERDEENDPIIHSFGVSGDNILPRMASISAASPDRRRHPLRASVSPPQQRPIVESMLKDRISAIHNHVINQLAFSRLHALPLSTIMNNLPATLKDETEDNGPKAQSREASQPQNRKLTDTDLKKLLDENPCVGEIVREGKDAAGKPLEDEFYYVPEMDTDDARRSAVENSTGLRAVRKQHKQYFWKRPRH